MRPSGDIPSSVVSTSASSTEPTNEQVRADQDSARDERLDRIEARTDALERENAELREKLKQASETQSTLTKRVDRLMPLTGRIGGYLDTGAFWVMGNGSGIRSDIGYQYFPEYE
ncbi:MAG: hypothetical protein ACPG77_11145, partial [Nannocystaceae bacterium]